MKKKGFFGYGRCPHCETFLKEKDLEKNICWSCAKVLKEKQKNKKIKTGSINDADGISYDTVKIGSQVWMAENLKVTHYQNGDIIDYIIDFNDWVNTSEGAYCNPHNDENNVRTFGRLYNWYAINDIRGISPKGWHIPKSYELDELITYLGGEKIASGKLKSLGTIENGDGLWDLWESTTEKYEATNDYGFSAVPSGNRQGDMEKGVWEFARLGNSASFWSSSGGFDFDSIRQDLKQYAPSYLYKESLDKLGPADAYAYSLAPGPLVWKQPMNIRSGMSVRCIKD